MKRRFALLSTALLSALLGVVLTLSALTMFQSAQASDEAAPLGAVRSKITRTALARTGITTTLSAPTFVTMAFANDGYTWVEITNTVASTKRITIETPGNVSGLPIEDLYFNVPANGSVKLGPFIGSLFNQRTTDKGYVYIEFPDTTSLRVGAFTVGGQ